MTRHFFTRLPLWSLGLLGVIELVYRYDTWARQGALVLTAIAALVIYPIVERRLARHRVFLPPAVAWLAASGVWFDALGNFAHFYARIPYWDRIAHLVGSIALAAALMVIFLELERERRILLGRFATVLFAVSIAMLLASLYESSEYIGDRLFATHRVTDLYDTADDLLWNLGGALLGAAGTMAFKNPTSNHV